MPQGVGPSVGLLDDDDEPCALAWLDRFLRRKMAARLFFRSPEPSSIAQPVFGSSSRTSVGSKFFWEKSADAPSSGTGTGSPASSFAAWKTRNEVTTKLPCGDRPGPFASLSERASRRIASIGWPFKSRVIV